MEVCHVHAMLGGRNREVTESVGGGGDRERAALLASTPRLRCAESSESKPDAFKGAYTVDESKWEMPEELKAKYA